MTPTKSPVPFAMALVLLFVGCHKQSSMSVKVHVKTGDGEDINGAIVKVDQEIIGETNAFGTLAYSFDAEQGSIHRIDVAKENETYYFAPHFETVKVPKAARSEWDVSATLYMVPKPRATKANLSEAIEPDKALAPEKDLAPIRTTSTHDKGVWSSYPFLDEEEFTPSTVDLSITEDASAQIKPAFSDETPLFTVHTYQGKDPMAHSEVYSCLAGRVPELLCTSNDRGRCVIRSDSMLSASSWSLLIKNPHTKTQILSGPFEKNANVRANLAAGKSDDYLVVYDDFGIRKPVADARVVISKESSIQTSSMCGVVTVASPKLSDAKTHLRISQASIKNGMQEFDADTQENKAFHTIEVMPEKRRAPSFVVEPVLPGANLTQEDFQQWFSVSQSKRSNLDVVRALKSAKFSALPLDEFQDVNRVNNRGVAVVQKHIKPWESDSKSVELASHRLRVVLFRAGLSLSISAQVFDARGAQVFAVKQVVPSTGDMPKVITTALQPFTAGLAKNAVPAWSQQDVVDPVGRWLIVRGERDNGSEPNWKSLDAGSTLVLKSGAGYLDLQVTVASDAILTAVFNPLSYQENLVEKIYEESAALNAIQIQSLLSGVEKTHPQRHRLDLMAAYIESLVRDSSEHMEGIAHDRSGESETLNQQMNRSIALVMLADREGATKEERLKNADEGIQRLDKIAASESAGLDPTSSTALKRLALYYRGQAKTIVGELKGDAMVAMDAEADTREFMKRSDDAPNKSSREERLRIAAAKALKATDLQ